MPQFFIKDDHEAIIPRDMFDAVQAERIRRSVKYGTDGGQTSELSGLIHCGICGHNCRRKTARVRMLWCCKTFNTRGKKYCASKAIPEETIRSACSQVLGLSEYDPAAVTGLDKFLMKTMRAVLLSGSTPDAKSQANMMKERIDNGCDLVKRENITSLVKDAGKIAERE